MWAKMMRFASPPKKNEKGENRESNQTPWVFERGSRDLETSIRGPTLSETGFFVNIHRQTTTQLRTTGLLDSVRAFGIKCAVHSV